MFPGIDRKGQIQGPEGAEDKTQFGTGFAALNGRDPLPPDADFVGELGLGSD